jgi:DNA-directed RNA polymerase specialized sigma24 family protein
MNQQQAILTLQVAAPVVRQTTRRFPRLEEDELRQEVALMVLRDPHINWEHQSIRAYLARAAKLTCLYAVRREMRERDRARTVPAVDSVSSHATQIEARQFLEQLRVLAGDKGLHAAAVRAGLTEQHEVHKSTITRRLQACRATAERLESM